MAFTTDLTADIGKVRLELGDDVELAGVLPGGGNLTDAQIQALLSREGSVMRTTAGAAEIIARRWAKAVSSAADGARRELQQIYDHWRQQAQDLRAIHGYAATVGSGFSVQPTRVDGYTDDASEYSRGDAP